jgi:hypothetical protein
MHVDNGDETALSLHPENPFLTHSKVRQVYDWKSPISITLFDVFRPCSMFFGSTRRFQSCSIFLVLFDVFRLHSMFFQFCSMFFGSVRYFRQITPHTTRIWLVLIQLCFIHLSSERLISFRFHFDFFGLIILFYIPF